MAAVAACLLSGIWNDNVGGADYWVRALIVIAGGAIAVVAARRRERAARAEAIGAQLTTALSNLAEAVIVLDENRRMVYANDAAAETLGYPVGRGAAQHARRPARGTRPTTSARTARRSGPTTSRRRGRCGARTRARC